LGVEVEVAERFIEVKGVEVEQGVLEKRVEEETKTKMVLKGSVLV